MAQLDEVLRLAKLRENLKRKQDVVKFAALTPFSGNDVYFERLKKACDVCINNDDMLGERAFRDIAYNIQEELLELAQSYQEEIDKIENEITSIITKQEANDCGHHNNNDITPG